MAQAKNYQVAVVIESVPNVYEAPSVGGDFIELAEPPTIVTDIESIERNVVRGSLGRLKQRRGQKIGTSELILELKSSGNVTASQADVARLEQLIDLALGKKNRAVSNDTVAGAGSTTTVIDTTLDDYVLGQGLMINNEVRHVKSLPGANQIELNAALSAPPGDTDVIIRGSTMSPDSADQRRASLTTFEQPVGTAGWRNRLIGAAIANMSIQEATNGSLPKMAFNFDSVDWEVEADITNAITPIFENSSPPDNLNVFMIIGGQVVDSNNYTLSVDKAVTPQKVITNNSGILNRIATDRNIGGQFDYYAEDDNSDIFDQFEENDTTDLQTQWGDRDSSNNLIQGTIISVYLPNAQLNSGSPDEEDGFIKRVVAFQAFEEALLDQEIFITIL